MAEFECGDVHRNPLADDEKGACAKPKVFKDGQYSDPLFKKLSKINGEINKLSKPELQQKLKEFGLDTRGLKEVLKKRLKHHYKKKKCMKARVNVVGKTQYDYIAVIDFEATCEENNPNFRHEIIEFPVVLVDVEQMEIVDKFQEYVRPVVNPKLTKFCTKLTGITQDKVDQSDIFPDVLAKVELWFQSHGLGENKTFAVLTDGPWDMFRFMYYQCKESGIEMPEWSKKWVNIRKAYCNFYHCPRGGIEIMLKNLGMEFEGSPHSGIDDAVNIARIALKLLNDGCRLSLNERISVKHNPRDSKTEVRYVVYQEPKEKEFEDSDEEQTEKKKSKEKKNRRKENDRQGDIEAKLDKLTIEDEEDEDYDDLLTYYKLQNS